MKHKDYLDHKSAISRLKYEKEMKRSLGKSKPEEFLPIKPNSDSSQPTKQTKNKNTVNIDIQCESLIQNPGEDVQ